MLPTRWSAVSSNIALLAMCRPHVLPLLFQAKLREFLALMPAEQRDAAATQLSSLPF